MKHNFNLIYAAVEETIKDTIMYYLSDYFKQALALKPYEVSSKIPRKSFALYGEPLFYIDIHSVHKAFYIMKEFMNILEADELYSTVFRNTRGEVIFIKKKGYRDMQVILYTGAAYLQNMKELGIDL